MQNPHDLKRMEGQAVDLTEAMSEREKDRVESEARATAAAEAYARRWERAMRRTFKGIMPNSTRRIFMKAHIARLEREGEA